MAEGGARRLISSPIVIQERGDFYSIDMLCRKTEAWITDAFKKIDIPNTNKHRSICLIIDISTAIYTCT